MRTKVTSFYSRAGILACLLLFSLVLTNCSKDDEPKTYEFDEFKDLDELPALEDADPEFTDPDAGSVEVSAETQAVIADLQDGSGDVTADTQSKLDATKSFADGLSTSVSAEVQALDTTRVEEILNADSLSGSLADLENSLDSLPAEVAALLPSINFSADYDAVAMAITRGPVDVSKDGIMSQGLSGPCYDAARAAYDAAMEEPIATRDEQLATVDANYNRRTGEADSRYDSRIGALDDQYAAYKSETKETALALLALADQVADDSLAKEIRTLALIYAVKGHEALTDWYTAASDLIATYRDNEKASLQQIKDERQATVNTNFDALKAQAQEALNQAYSKCHNQGSGN